MLRELALASDTLYRFFPQTVLALEGFLLVLKKLPPPCLPSDAPTTEAAIRRASAELPRKVCRPLPGPRNCKNIASRGFQKASTKLQKPPEASGKLPEASRKLPQSLQKLPQSLHKLPEVSTTPPEASRKPPQSLQKLPEASRSLLKFPEDSRSLQKPPEASRSFQKISAYDIF